MGIRNKTRHMLAKDLRTKGKVSISKYFRKFKNGDRVTLVIEPSVQKGVFNPRFQGKAGIVKGKKGKCYEVVIKDNRREKTLIVHPVHMVK